MEYSDLVNLICEFLEISDDISNNVEIDFSEIESLKKVQLIIELEAATGKSVSLIDFLESKTIKDIIDSLHSEDELT